VARRRRSIVAPVGAVTASGLVIAVVAWWVWPVTRSSSPPATAVATAIASSQPLAAPRLSIVVLPFANLSNDHDQRYFADGITEDLTTDLSRISDMFVISCNTALTYRNKPVDTKQIGRELGVRYVLLEADLSPPAGVVLECLSNRSEPIACPAGPLVTVAGLAVRLTGFDDSFDHRRMPASFAREIRKVFGPLGAQGVIADDRCLSKRRREADRPPQVNGHWT
jgi:hypothetical protein